MAFIPKTVKTSRPYSTEEILEVLKAKSDLPEPYIQKGLIGSGVGIPGANSGFLTASYDVLITSNKKGITVSQVIGGSSKGGILKNLVKDNILPTAGLLTMNKNKELIDFAVEEIKRLFTDGGEV
jgi:hypothetical protein